VVAFLATWLVQDELHVLNVATDPAHRRRGHARALMQHAIRFGVEHGVRMVLLEVRRSNAAAIALYRQLGFTAMGVRARYYSNDEDAVEMVARIDPATGAVVPGRDEIRV
jgi:ribosomal-protein-alanine N-acetyltransferase